MASGLTQYDKQIGLKKAWHGETEVLEVIDPKDNWLLDWDVKRVPVYVVRSIPGDIRGPSYKQYTKLEGIDILAATDDESITIGKPIADSYSPLSNKAFMGLIQQVIDETEGLTIESLGSVNGRGRVFCSVSLKDAKHYNAGGRDFEDFLNFGNSHDKSCPVWVNNTNTCIVCNNTFSYNLGQNKNKSWIRVIHKGDMEAKITNVKGLITSYLENQQIFINKFNTLADITVSPEEVENLYKGFLKKMEISPSDKAVMELSTRATNKVKNLMYLFEEGKGNSGNTLADAFSAVTDLCTHGTNPLKLKSNSEALGKQIVSSEYGNGNKSKQIFWDIVTNENTMLETIDLGKQYTLAS